MSSTRRLSPPPSRTQSRSPSFASTPTDDLQEPLILNKFDDPSYRASAAKFRPRRRHIYVASIALAALSLFALLFFGFWTTHEQDDDIAALKQSTELSEKLASHRYLNGPPTEKFRDNLRPDAKYITSWISAGWTNDVMTYMNLVYLGMITERIPVIPMFTPSHIGGSEPPIRFGEVFDVPRLSQLLGKPILEWHEVKNSSSETLDEIGCWSVFDAIKDDEGPRYSVIPSMLRLDISYTRAPSWIKLIPHYQHDLHSTFWSLATLAFPENRADNLVVPIESQAHHVSLPPDEQLLCYDYLYFVCAAQPYEFDFDYSPAWRFVGRHFRWAAPLEKLADDYVRQTFGTEEDKATPPFITIHIRHGDFRAWCGESTEGCFASLPIIARRVNEVKAELLERKGLTVDHVIMTSDEREPAWWDDVVKQGWYAVDHSKTTELYGAWYPVLIDAVIQSNGAGFVGTDRSTMSTLARRRVQSWRDGVVRTVKWGKPDSDDH